MQKLTPRLWNYDLNVVKLGKIPNIDALCGKEREEISTFPARVLKQSLRYHQLLKVFLEYL